MSETESTEARLVAGLWQVVAAHGWHGLTMRRLAEASGVPAATIRRLAPAPHELLRLHARLADEAVLAGTVPGQGGAPRDRIFDVLMRRIDALQPHRRGILRLLRDLPAEPLAAAVLLGSVPRSMVWMLEAAELSPAGLQGALRVQGMGAIWLAVLRAWTRDGTADLAPTMAALDRALDRAEQVARSLRLDPGEGVGPGPAGA